MSKYKLFGESAIHDRGFQFQLTLNIKFYIEDLVKDMHTLEKCLGTHKEWKQKEPWYNSKITVGINNSIEGYKMYHEFTMSQCLQVYRERKKFYDLLISMAEESLDEAKKSEMNEYGWHKPFHEDPERVNVIVYESEAIQ